MNSSLGVFTFATSDYRKLAVTVEPAIGRLYFAGITAIGATGSHGEPATGHSLIGANLNVIL